MAQGLSSRLKDRVLIERPKSAPGLKSAGSGGWEPVAEVAAEVLDVLPSRAERMGTGINLATRPARILIRPRAGITPDMRFVMGSRIMQIIAGPAKNEDLNALEFRVEDYSVAGPGA